MIASGQVAGVYRRRVGDVLVTALHDGEAVLLEALIGITPAESEMVLRAAGRRPPFHTAINTFLLQWPERTVLVDTGAGSQFGPGAGKLPTSLNAAGVAPADIGDVVLTHLHGDHVGGLVNATGGPAYPNAQLWVAEPEISFWQDDANKAAAPEGRRNGFDLARAMVKPYADRLQRVPYGEIMPGLEAVALPGHTPGHTGYMVTSRGEKLLIWGDIFHMPVVQAARPDVGTAFDTDPALAVQTRRAVLERAVNEDLLVTGMHMSFPGLARIARSGDGYAVQPEAWRAEI